MRKKQTIVIKFDGIDGCGKSTLIQNLYERLKAHYRTCTVKEFGDSRDFQVAEISKDKSISELLKIIAKSDNTFIDDIEREILWSFISRRTNRLIIPSLRKKFQLILVDRSNLGNYAYGMVLYPELKKVFDVVNTDLESADIIFWIDTPVDVCEERLLARHRDVIEIKGKEFFTNVRTIYLKYYRKNENIIRLNGSQSKEQLLIDVLNTLKNKFNI